MGNEILKGNADIEASSMWEPRQVLEEPAPIPYPHGALPADPPRWCYPVPDPIFGNGIAQVNAMREVLATAKVLPSVDETDEILAAVIQRGKVAAALVR